MTTQTIVLARLVEQQRIKKVGQVDIGRPHVWETYLAPEAVVWLNAGEEADVEKAQDYALQQGWVVFCYPTSETEPLNRARKEIEKGT